MTEISVKQLKYAFYSIMLDEMYERYCKKCKNVNYCWRGEGVFHAEKILKVCSINQIKACIVEIEENFTEISLAQYSKLLNKLTLSIFEKCKIKRLSMPKYVGHYKDKDWQAKLPFYVAYCKFHDLFFIDYPHGRTNYFYCPLCLKEAIEQWEASR